MYYLCVDLLILLMDLCNCCEVKFNYPLLFKFLDNFRKRNRFFRPSICLFPNLLNYCRILFSLCFIGCVMNSFSSLFGYLENTRKTECLFNFRVKTRRELDITCTVF